jgi:hypothetical protein
MAVHLRVAECFKKLGKIQHLEATKSMQQRKSPQRARVPSGEPSISLLSWPRHSHRRPNCVGPPDRLYKERSVHHSTTTTTTKTTHRRDSTSLAVHTCARTGGSRPACSRQSPTGGGARGAHAYLLAAHSAVWAMMPLSWASSWW